MHTDLRQFLATYLRIVLMALLPVFFTAFITMPYYLKDSQVLPEAMAEVPADYHIT